MFRIFAFKKITENNQLSTFSVNQLIVPTLLIEMSKLSLDLLSLMTLMSSQQILVKLLLITRDVFNPVCQVFVCLFVCSKIQKCVNKIW